MEVAGKLHSGPVFNKRKSEKLKYKLRINERQALELKEQSNDLHEALINKNGKDLWKSWRSKFGSPHKTVVQVDGLTTDTDIGSKFALHFSKACSYTPSDRSDSLLTNYLSIRVDYTGETLPDDYLVNVELIDTIIYNLNNVEPLALTISQQNIYNFRIRSSLPF